MIFLLKHWKALAFIALAVAIWCSGFHSRGVVEQAKKAAELERQKEDNAKRQALAYRAGINYAERQRKASVESSKISNEVIRYVQVHERIPLPESWRLLHDAAATNTASVARSAAGAGPTDDAASISTVTGNYAECQKWRNQVIGWQDWYASIHTK